MDGWTDTHFNLENNKKSRPKYLQTLSPPKLQPPLILPWKNIPLFAAHSSHNTLQGLHLHVSRGDNVICINLMSLSKEKTLWVPAETSRHCSKAFFPLITDNIGLGLQTKHCYTDYQEVWHLCHQRGCFLGRKNVHRRWNFIPAKWVAQIVSMISIQGLVCWEELTITRHLYRCVMATEVCGILMKAVQLSVTKWAN